MDSYIARRPILDTDYRTYGYELICEGSMVRDHATVFGIAKLTNEKPAFLDFTQTLIEDDKVYLLKPEEVVIEVSEQAVNDWRFIKKMTELKEKDYSLALSDYSGNSYSTELLRIVDYVKVNFKETEYQTKKEIGMFSKTLPRVHILADHVDTEEEYLEAVKLGYLYFQGDFFAKPASGKKADTSISMVTYSSLVTELGRAGGINFSTCAKIVHKDATLTYRTLEKAHTLRYYRGNMITAVQSALVMMGEEEVRRWILLMLAKDNNVTGSDEIVRAAYARGCFAQSLSKKYFQKMDGEYAFLLGMFSLMDLILGMRMIDILDNVLLPVRLRKALLNEEESEYTLLLKLVKKYESEPEEFSEKEIGASAEEIARFYMKALQMTDQAFHIER